jgi:RNA polymerase sigma factor (sigma-70 family)
MEASPTTNRYGLRGSVAGSRLLLLQSDAVLCKLCARGSDDAFDVLHARYRQQVFAFVFHLLNRRDAIDDAEDITQEVFGRAFAAIRTKRSEGSFKHWLFAIARNKTFDHIRARKPQSVSLDDENGVHVEPTNVVSISSQVERRAELAWMVTAVSRLPVRQREALVMRELGGMSHAEIAAELNINVNATKQLIKRGRESVSAAAELSGYRSRDLGKDLAMAAPILPLAAVGLGMTASGASAAVGFGGVALATKLAVAVAVVATVSGSVVAAKEVTIHAANGASSRTASQRRVVSQSLPGGASGTMLLPGATGRVAMSSKSGHSESRDGHGSRSSGRGKSKHAKSDSTSRGNSAANRRLTNHPKGSQNAGKGTTNSNGSNGSEGAGSGGTSSGAGGGPNPASNGGNSSSGSAGSGGGDAAATPGNSGSDGGSHGSNGKPAAGK